MNTEHTITVYAFRPRIAHEDAPRWLRYKAPRDVIENQLGAVVIEGTAEVVPASELDASGCFCRLATGWGELRPVGGKH